MSRFTIWSSPEGRSYLETFVSVSKTGDQYLHIPYKKGIEMRVRITGRKAIVDFWKNDEITGAPELSVGEKVKSDVGDKNNSAS